MVEAQFALAVDLRLLHMHVDAERAAVDLRSPQVDEIADCLLDDAVLQAEAEVGDFLEELG
ncbi:hypothetical protein D3C72_2338700 [compost metagenome]